MDQRSDKEIEVFVRGWCLGNVNEKEDGLHGKGTYIRTDKVKEVYTLVFSRRVHSDQRSVDNL